MRRGQNSIPPVGVAGAKAAPDTFSYRVLHRFSFAGRGGTCCPNESLVNVNGTLYGMTSGGTPNKHECGTVFSISPSGVHRTIHRFQGADGCAPQDALINVHGTLYGTTYVGGSCCGVVFSLTPSGVEKVLYNFKGAPDGAHPWGGLVELNGTLYGTTSDGGNVGGSNCPNSFGIYGCGTVYSITTSGTESVLYRFNGAPDGFQPLASMIAVHGKLYGTTVSGGLYWGTVFSVTTTGSENVVYSFKGGDDGNYPFSPLLYRNGKLFGTTLNGGSSDKGNVYSVTPTGVEKVLYTFAGGTDGQLPGGRLIDVNGIFYSTTNSGGGSGCNSGSGCGTIFSVTPSGSENVLYSFKGGTDGADSNAGLVNLNGTLYGTTLSGGGKGCGGSGCGTVFAITP
jgi:uncharacterized repeat protein (TIGR03803 family)